MENEKTLKDLFGVEEDEIQTFKPLLNLPKMAIGTTVKVEFVEDEPREVAVKSKFGKDKAKMIDVIEISDESNKIEYSMFIGAKTLLNGIARLYLENGNSLKGTKASITISSADFEKGTNRCYNVKRLN